MSRPVLALLLLVLASLTACSGGALSQAAERLRAVPAVADGTLAAA